MFVHKIQHFVRTEDREENLEVKSPILLIQVFAVLCFLVTVLSELTGMRYKFQNVLDCDSTKPYFFFSLESLVYSEAFRSRLVHLHLLRVGFF